jgi:hypothetical protein
MDLRDERGILVSWLVKLLLGLAIAGLVLFDAGAIAVNTFTLSSSANDIANALATSIQQSGSARPNEAALQDEGKELADEAGATLVSVSIDTQARVVKVRLRRRADTLIVSHVGPIEDWGRATADGQSGYQ